MKVIRIILAILIILKYVKSMLNLKRKVDFRDNFNIFRNNYVFNFSKFPQELPVDNPNNSTSYIKFQWILKNYNLTSIESKEVIITYIYF